MVAEGVEDDATWARLDAIGCGFVQGYQLARPMPLAEFPHWLPTSSLRPRRIDLVRTEIPERRS